jgi:hypothetical protein
MHTKNPSITRLVFALAAMGAGLALSGCQVTPTTVSPPPAPTLQLIESQPLVMAEDCTPAEGSYYVGFTVLRDGRTDKIQSGPRGPACVQRALTAWVSSFRYSPPGQEMLVGIEWMMVAGRTGI